MNWDDIKEDEQQLAQLANELSASKIARKYGVDHKTVTYWLDKHGYIYYDKKWIKEDDIEEEAEEVIEDEETSKGINVDEFETYYHVYTDKRAINISKHKLKQIYKNYCEYGVTQDETCTKCNIAMEDFKLVKKAFGFVHDSIPYPDDEIENRPIEDLVDETIQRRKQKYEELLQVKEMRRLKRIEKKYQEDLHFAKQVINEIEDTITADDYIEPKYEIKEVNNKKLMIISLADLHYGKKVLGNLILGQEEGFNKNILKDRLNKYLNEVIEEIKTLKPYKIIVVDTGDITDDPQAQTYENQVYNQDVTRESQLFGCADLVKEFIKELYNYITNIKAIFLPGNHSDSRLNSDIIIGNIVQRELANYDIDFDIVNKPFKVEKELGFNLVFNHGNNIRNGKNTGEVDRLNIIQRLRLQKENTYLFTGHYHSEKGDGTGYERHQLPSIVGNDDFNANDLNVFSRPAQMFFTLTKDGLTGRRKVYFN